ncbi:MAG: asparagine synthase-related protein [Acidimicrobiales bacterium]
MTGHPNGGVWYPAANPDGLSELEVAAGLVVGQADGPHFTADHSVHPIAALRELATTLLAIPPCVVAFSGGRDSSALLAVLLDVARLEGLDEPIAVTARWDDDEASGESAWQEEVVRAIGVDRWEIIRPGTDLDLLGDEAAGVLDRLGLVWPAPAHALIPMIRLAAGGVFLSGEGGDEAFGLWPYGRLWADIRARRVPRRSDLCSLALGCTPRALRRRHWQRSQPPYQTWLQPSALARLAEDQAEDQADDPLRWDRYQVVSRRRRATELTLGTLERLCALHSSRFAAPFTDERFLSALAAWGGPLGRGDRTAVMTALFSDVLPGTVVARTSKASFGAVFWGPACRRFAEEWDGTGLSPELVDPEALRRAWLAPVPVYGAALPLHAAWLYERRARRRVTEPPTP